MGTVTGTRNYTGGIAGSNDENGTIRNCYTTCNVTANDASATFRGNSVGGIAGFNYGAIQYCYAMGDIEGWNNVGGVVGYSDGGSVQNCVAVNDEITARNTSTANAGQVLGYISNSPALAKLFAIIGIPFTAVDVTVTSRQTGIHGAAAVDASVNGSNSGTWWTGTGANDPAFPAASWDAGVNRLPYLKTSAGAEFSQVQ
jgi:hypothetical protein